MFFSVNRRVSWLSAALLILTASAAALAQAHPLLQTITVQSTPVPLVKKTGSASSTLPNTADLPSTEMAIPGYSGVLVETLDGKLVKESYSSYPFNPASNVKVATTFAVLKTFGPDYRFPTNVFTDGTFDRATGTLNGNLYISGRDPSFTLENGVELADALNKNGIRTVAGDLIVTDRFVMSLVSAPQVSANVLFATLDASKRSATATRAWQDYIVASGKYGKVDPNASVSFTGKAFVEIIPNTAKLLFSHESAPLREIIKTMMCFSNNFMAERLGDMLGGAYAVSRVVQQNTGVPPEAFYLQTSSGLGENRVTPQAFMKLLRALRAELGRYKMTFMDIMPVAGVDPGTLAHRFDGTYDRGTVVGKTGTLGNTDGGTSALSGEIQTRKGKLLFVIFNQRGVVGRFRNFQNDFVTMIQNQFGGPAPLGYAAPTVASRMAQTRITYPDTRSRMN
jgi:serine-type D-Ala-D-Ala carboxypeptidase/endopeptidase (penicillin-binding protein 4)